MTTGISAFRRGVLPSVIGCPPFIVDQAVVDAIIQLCKDINLFQRAFGHSVDASADVDTDDNNSIEIDLSDYVTDTLRPHLVKELKIDGADWATSYLTLGAFDEDFSLPEIVGTKYFNYPDIGTFKMFPMDPVKDVFVYLKFIWIPLETMTTVDDIVYNDHRRAVEHYAKWYLMSQPKKTWTDLALADYYLSKYSEKMEEGKIEILQGKTFGSLRPKSMRFF